MGNHKQEFDGAGLSVERVQPGEYQIHHDWHSGPVSTTLSLALAEINGTDPTEVIDDLTRYVDPDALNRLFKPTPAGEARGPGTLELEIGGYTIEIRSNGDIIITE